MNYEILSAKIKSSKIARIKRQLELARKALQMQKEYIETAKAVVDLALAEIQDLKIEAARAEAEEITKHTS